MKIPLVSRFLYLVPVIIVLWFCAAAASLGVWFALCLLSLRCCMVTANSLSSVVVVVLAVVWIVRSIGLLFVLRC